ncbi:Putative PrpF protein [Septoria linicola]|uniref:PrpF protein n=1 Tax=Septoria linicola TaxID=215465 RepID=A0A9Q9ALS4_9PEZI|nr:putative PrpF protein [Septoria linicola]USW48790.1 Putative PrpF protein [Septoria linicola]
MAIDALSPPLQRPRKQRRTLPAVWMRAGTSKGPFLHQRDLPPKQEQWAPIILAAMGSQDAGPKQLNGIAGATSTTSKVAVIKPSERPGIDVEYTFVQVSIGSPKLDFTGNCGNIASGVGPFAVDEGLVQPRPGQKTVDIRILNTNTGRTIVETLDVDQEGYFLEDGDYQLAGTRWSGSPIGVSFEKPAGAMTGCLLPSGRPVETAHIPGSIVRPSCDVNVSLVDAANPFVLLDASSLPEAVRSTDTSSAYFLDFVEVVRCHGAVRMGLAETTFLMFKSLPSAWGKCIVVFS